VYTGKLEPLAQAAAMLAGHELDSLSKIKIKTVY